jgi:S1-C subfamily serine protease
MMLWLTSSASAQTDTSSIYQATEKSVYQIRVINKQTSKKASIGSGFTVVKNNILATNYHVVSGYVNAPNKYDLEYLAKDGRQGKLEILDLDTTHDLAVLRALDELGPPLKIAPLPEKGAHLYSLGNPMDLGFSIVKGVNNGVMKNSEEKNILVSGSLNPGMSGGPTLNEDGNVIGINVATSGNEISFLVPAEHLTNILERLNSRDYEAVHNIYDTISQQLVKNSQDKIQDLLDNDWGGTTISGFNVPSELSKTYKCSDGSPSIKKDVIYSLTL